MVRPPKYPWDVWLDASTPVHIDCADYDVEVADLQQQALAAARVRKVKITTSRCKVAHRDFDGDCLSITRVRNKQTNWDRLLSGDRWIVAYDTLRTRTPESFIRSARRAAAARDVTVEIDRRTSPLGMYVQAKPKR